MQRLFLKRPAGHKIAYAKDYPRYYFGEVSSRSPSKCDAISVDIGYIYTNCTFADSSLPVGTLQNGAI